MSPVCKTALAAVAAASLWSPAPVWGQTPQQTAPSAAQPPAQKPEEAPKFEETVVVSASKAEEKLIDAPATMSVITSLAIETAP